MLGKRLARVTTHDTWPLAAAAHSAEHGGQWGGGEASWPCSRQIACRGKRPPAGQGCLGGTASHAATGACTCTHPRAPVPPPPPPAPPLQYFVRGVGDMSAYAPDCTFSDPFVSFKGTQRFKQNVGNLGGLM